MKDRFPWTRYWCPPDAVLHMESNGYVLSPRGTFGASIQSTLRTLQALSGEKCLVLLGEPGSGKSEEIMQEAKRLKNEGRTVGIIDLRSIQNANDLGAHPVTKELLNSTDQFTLFLDSFDECSMGATVLCDTLSTWFKQLPKERMLIRVACRTADQPPRNMLGEGLEESFLDSKEEPKTYEITALDEEAVREALKASNLDPDKILKDFDEAGVGALAAKPITLRMLVGLLKGGEGLPKQRAELYEKACLKLCEENNDGRIANDDFGKVDLEQRMRVAGRIAAYSLLKRADAIELISPHDPKDENKDIQIRDVSWGTEKAAGKVLAVDDSVVREILKRSGLFTSRGGDRIGWSHQTYPDFLAAWYIHQRDLDPKQIDSMLRHPSSGRVRPHLAECAAWLASMDKTFFAKVMQDDPGILLRTDGSAMSVRERQEVTGALLSAFDQKKLLDFSLGIRNGYRKLAFPGMSGVLLPYITDLSRNGVVRRAAIDMAESCNVNELTEILLKIALDDTEDINIRIQAANAIKKLDSEEAKIGLAILLKDPSAMNDELRGIVIAALYPKHLSLEEILALLKDREDSKGVIRLTSIDHFLFEHAEEFDAKDIAAILRWTESLGDVHTMDRSNKRFMEHTLERAWHMVDDPDVAPALASAVKVRLALEGSSWGRASFGMPEELEDAERLNMAKFIIENAILEDGALVSLAYGKAVVLSADLDALLVILSSALPRFKKSWATLIRGLVSMWDRAGLEKVMSVYESSPELKAAFSGILGSVDLDSAEAATQRADHESRLRIQEMYEIREEKQPKEPTLEETLNLPAENTWRQWPLVAMLLNADIHSIPEGDIETSSGWVAADAITRERIINIAKGYIEKCAPKPEQWKLEKGKILQSSLFGHLALRLIHKTTKAGLSIFSKQQLGEWAAAMIPCPINPDEIDQEITKQIYQASPKSLIEAVEYFIGRDHTIERHVRTCWDKTIEGIFFKEAGKPELSAKAFEDLLEGMFRHANSRALKLAIDEMVVQARSKEHRTIAAIESFIHAPKEVWPHIKQIINADPEFGKQVFQEVSQYMSRDSEKVIDQLPLEERGKLYIWMRQQYPVSDDDMKSGYIGPVGLRDAVLRSIRDSGEAEAMAVLKEIEKAFPEDEWLSWTQVGAMDAIVDKSGAPLSSAEIKKLLESKDVRLVQTGEQLLGVIKESLDRMQKDLQGETPMARLFWERCGDKIRPKDEGELSDYIKKHLEQDLKQVIVAKREVEIRKKSYTTPMGDAPDIEVVFTHNEDAGQITLVIEVKGDWNREVMTAMETQLRTQYLEKPGYRFGLYVVGRYESKERKSKVLPQGAILQETRTIFDKQAEKLSTPQVTLRAHVLDMTLDQESKPRKQKLKKPAASTRKKTKIKKKSR